ncbi:MAG TPA: hypothetical protein VJV78_24060 [Polyangiales bacterium]|nr:hypothetical protein [Polyangiales bacterium]
MSRAFEDILGNAFRVLLVAVALFGYVAHLFAFRGYYHLVGRDDGWSGLGPMMSIFFFSPLQLAAAASLVRAYMNAGLPEVAAPSLPTGAYGLENVERNLVRGRRVALAGYWTLGVPAFFVGVCVLGALMTHPLPGASILVGPVSVLWIPMWFAGVVAAFSAANRHDDSSLLLLAGGYPVLSIVYAWL